MWIPAIKQYDAMQEMGITNIINVTNNLRPTEEHYKLFDVFYLPLKDEENYNIINAIKTCSFYIDLLTKNNKKKCVVHCSAGISRSSSIIIGYCMIYKKKKLKECYKFVKGKKKNIAPNVGFMKQLIELEKEIFNINESTINLTDYIIDLLHQVFPQQNRNKIGNVLKNCNGDYSKAQTVLFQSMLNTKNDNAFSKFSTI